MIGRDVLAGFLPVGLWEDRNVAESELAWLAEAEAALTRARTMELEQRYASACFEAWQCARYVLRGLYATRQKEPQGASIAALLRSLQPEVRGDLLARAESLDALFELQKSTGYCSALRCQVAIESAHAIVSFVRDALTDPPRGRTT